MTTPASGQRASWQWGCYSLGEMAETLWRVSDLLGSAVEPVSVTIEPPLEEGGRPGVGLVVREYVDLRWLVDRLPEEARESSWSAQQYTLLVCELDEFELTIRVEQEL
jgi:hypothetical protein